MFNGDNDRKLPFSANKKIPACEWRVNMGASNRGPQGSVRLLGKAFRTRPQGASRELNPLLGPGIGRSTVPNGIVIHGSGLGPCPHISIRPHTSRPSLAENYSQNHDPRKQGDINCDSQEQPSSWASF